MSAYNSKYHHRRSIRLKGYDYSQAGLYFVTKCVQNRDCLFGNISDGIMQLNDAGKMIEKWYFELENKFPDIKCGEHIIMPNHFHCIIHNVGAVGADLRVCPDELNTRIPAMDEKQSTFLDEKSSLSLDEKSSLSMDEKHSTFLDEKSSVELDEKSSLSMDEKHSTFLDEKSSVELDEKSSLSMDEKQSTFLDEKSSVELDEKSSLSMDEKSSTFLDEKSSVELDEKSSLSKDEKSSTFLDEKSSMILGEHSSMILGEHSSMILGEHSSMILGEHSSTILGEHIGSPLHRVMQWFSTMSTNEYIRNVKSNNWDRFDVKLWQRNYWEHIIRNEKSYQRISKYIINNPKNWDDDKFKK